MKHKKTHNAGGCRLFYHLVWLPDLDSNQDNQNQNLMYYRYTIGQSDGKFRGLFFFFRPECKKFSFFPQTTVHTGCYNGFYFYSIFSA